ncbi:MAG: hypothetical protein ABH825_01655 [Candidatus Omnitrophota bacterium]
MKGKVKIRRRWKITPKSRVRESEKLYSRKKAKAGLRKALLKDEK